MPGVDVTATEGVAGADVAGVDGVASVTVTVTVTSVSGGGRPAGTDGFLAPVAEETSAADAPSPTGFAVEATSVRSGSIRVCGTDLSDSEFALA
jgi:hypothetical protein